MTDKLRDALHQYEQIGPSKMERGALNLIRDNAKLVLAAQSAEAPAYLESSFESPNTAWAADRAREMLKTGINLQATGEATNNLISGMMSHLLEHIDELTAERDKARAEQAQLVEDYGERGDLLAECRVELQEQVGKRLETHKRASALEALLAEAGAERDEARELAQRSTRRLVELSEPGWIGAFAARDAAESRASALETLVAECETVLARADDALAKQAKYPRCVEVDHAWVAIRHLLAKLKARTGDA